jgi:hypothetical protein
MFLHQVTVVDWQTPGGTGKFFTKGNDDYPEISSMPIVSLQYKHWQPKYSPPDSSAVAFVQKTGRVRDKRKDDSWELKATATYVGKSVISV